MKEKGNVRNLPAVQNMSRGLLEFCSEKTPEDIQEYIATYRVCMREARQVAAGMYWVTGRFLTEMELKGEKAAAKAAIAAEGISDRSLEECCQFYKAFPDWKDVDYLSSKLPWSAAREGGHRPGQGRHDRRRSQESDGRHP